MPTSTESLDAFRESVDDASSITEPRAIEEDLASRQQDNTVPDGPVDDVDNTSEPAQAVSFALVSVITDEIQLLAELPTWAGGLLDGRMTAVLSDLLRVMGGDGATADWQYFRWPIDGMPDQSHHAATEAVDAWLHRRWAEMQAAEPVMLTSMQSLDASVLTADALMLPALEALLIDPEAKRMVWERIQSHQHG
jgi:hypothetical protein